MNTKYRIIQVIKEKELVKTGAFLKNFAWFVSFESDCYILTLFFFPLKKAYFSQPPLIMAS